MGENGQRILYENRILLDAEFPVSVSFRKSNSATGGCELHWHEALELYYVKKGGVSLLHNGNIDWLYRGDAGFLNWCEPHRGNGFLDGTEHYIIQIGTELFADEMVSGCPECRTENLLMMLITNHETIQRIFRNNQQLNTQLNLMIWEAENKKLGYEQKIKAAALNILIFLLRESNCQPENVLSKDLSTLEHLKKVLAYLSFHCTEPEKVTLEALSKRFGLSVPYLCRIFKKHTTLTVTSYVNELRCSRAAAYIQSGESLEKAAAITGFRDYNYFSRLFKKVVGVTPTEYRKKNEL